MCEDGKFFMGLFMLFCLTIIVVVISDTLIQINKANHAYPAQVSSTEK